MRRLLSHEKYSCEEALVEHLITVARAHGFKAYVETSDFDVLLIAGPESKGFKDGDQIGIQAKLRDNVDVLAQSLPKRHGARPHYYAVLVPSCSESFARVAARLEIGVICGIGLNETRHWERLFGRMRWKRQEEGARCWVPDCEVEGMRGGRKGPQQITKWKMAAIKLCLLAEEQGFITSREFREMGISMDVWVKKRWLVLYDHVIVGKRKVKRFVLNNAANPPHLRYGVVTDAMGKAGVIG